MIDALTEDQTQVGLIVERMKLGGFVYLASLTAHLDRFVFVAANGPGSAGKAWPGGRP